jgi:hypothetical protein
MFRQNGFFVTAANTAQTITADIQEVVYTGNGTGTYVYTLPEIGTTGLYGSKTMPGSAITIRNAGSGSLGLLDVTKHANNTGIYVGSTTSVTSFLLHPGSSVKLMAGADSYWYVIDGTNFFDAWDDLEFLTSARAASTNSAVLTDIGTGVEAWQFQPSTSGGSANKWLMCQRQITHGWDKQPVQFHIHFSPATNLIATGTGIVVTWTFIWRSVHPGPAIAWTNESNFTMTYSLASGTLSTANNYNASTGGNNSGTTITNGFPSTMILGRLEFTSITNNGANQSNELILNGFDAHIKLRKRGTVNAFPEP